MKTHDQIKKALEYCMQLACPLEECPYYDAESCAQDKTYDALAYIQQLETENHQLLTRCERLERERDALMHWAKGRCDTCAHNGDCVKHDPDPEGLIVHWYDDCEIWEWRGVKEE